MPLYRLKACTKCEGDLVLDDDEWKCSQCGTYYYTIRQVVESIIICSCGFQTNSAVDFTVHQEQYKDEEQGHRRVTPVMDRRTHRRRRKR